MNPNLDAPSITLIREGHPRARKHHQCDVCGCSIPTGSLYSYFVYTDNDSFDHLRLRTAHIHFFCPLES